MSTDELQDFDICSSKIKNFSTFAQVGGLSNHLKTLKELIIFPLVYTNVYSRFKIKPPRGVLFYGPPGTGKTLVAGALARECSDGICGKVSFFNRKGADILDKYIGESEQKLRALFQKASEESPSIIFFDEIDGIAPVRSSRYDQVHASIVSTMLALMDGLDKMPGVVVIGATNRIDAIDPALRRSGRFDRELYFPLPAVKARREILEVHMKSWAVKPKPSLLDYLANITVGYCGADLQALCSEAVLACLRRNYPEIHKKKSKINIRVRNLKVEECDFLAARLSITPSAHRSTILMRKLSNVVQPLLQHQLSKILTSIEHRWPHFTQPDYKYDIGSTRYAGRLLIIGDQYQGHNTHIAPALLHALEHLPVFLIDVQNLYDTGSQTAEEKCVQKLTLARQNMPAILMTYRLDEWWDIVENRTRALIISMLEDLNAHLPLLVIATATTQLPVSLQNYFGIHSSIIVNMENPDKNERLDFINNIFKMVHKICLDYTYSENKNEDREENGYPEPNIKCTTPRKRPNVPNIPNVSKKPRFQLTRTSHSNSTFSRRSAAGRRRGRPPTRRIKKGTLSSSWFPVSQAIDLAKKSGGSFTNVTDSVQERQIHTHFLNTEFQNKSTSSFTYEEAEEEIRTENPNCSKNENLLCGKVRCLYNRALMVTTKDMRVAQLELFYDMLTACVHREGQDAPTMLENVENIMADFERKVTLDNLKAATSASLNCE